MLLVTGAGGPASTNFISALRLYDPAVKLLGSDSNRNMLALAKVDVHEVIPSAVSSDYNAAIRKLLEKYSVFALHAQPDVEVYAIAKARESIDCELFLPPIQEIEICRDKARLASVLKYHSVPCPNFIDLGTNPLQSNETITFLNQHEKVWVRAKSGAGARAALPFTDKKLIRFWIQWWSRERGLSDSDFMISEFLPGPEYAVQAVFQNGELIALETRERVEYLFGNWFAHGQSSSPSVARTSSNPRVKDIALSAISSVSKSPHGVYGIDIKTNSMGQEVVTEINCGRLYTTSLFYAVAGVNFAGLIIEALRGQSLSRFKTPPNSLDPNLSWIRHVDMGNALVSPEGRVLWRSS